jgi:hypothetical protein
MHKINLFFLVSPDPAGFYYADCIRSVKNMGKNRSHGPSSSSWQTQAGRQAGRQHGSSSIPSPSPGLASPVPRGGTATELWSVPNMLNHGQISIKTKNPKSKCHLYKCLIEFIDRR